MALIGFLIIIIVIIVNLKYQDGSSNHLQCFFFVFFFKLGWMTLNLQLPQGITLGMAFRYTFIRMSYSIILLMIEVIIRKKYWFSIWVKLGWECLYYTSAANSFFSDLPNTMLRIMFSTEHCWRLMAFVSLYLSMER